MSLVATTLSTSGTEMETVYLKEPFKNANELMSYFRSNEIPFVYNGKFHMPDCEEFVADEWKNMVNTCTGVEYVYNGKFYEEYPLWGRLIR